MNTPADSTPRRRFRLSPSMRPRRRWSSYARQTAVREILDQLAMAEEEKCNLLQSLRLMARQPVRPIGALPAVFVTVAMIMGFLALLLLAAPFPICLFALLPLAVGVIHVRLAARDNRHFHRVSLVQSELAQQLADTMDHGETLSHAMEAHPRIFAPAHVAVVRAGEAAGNLAPALRTLSREAAIRQGGGVLNFYRLYAFYAFFMIFTVGLFIVWKIYPKFIDIFEQLGLELPPMTLRVLNFVGARLPWIAADVGFLLLVLLLCIYVDHLVRLYLGRFASGVVCSALLARLLVADLLFQSGLDGAAVVPFVLGLGFAIPFISDLLRGLIHSAAAHVALLIPSLRQRRCALERSNFLRSLGIMFERRVAAPEALRLAAPALAPAGLARSAQAAARAVEQGRPLIDALTDLHLLRPRERQMLRLADAAGELPRECLQLSDNLADDAREFIAESERVLRPVVVLGVAAVAFVILYSVYAPIFQIAALVPR